MANMSSPARSVGSSNPAHRKYIETYEVDKRSVHVGSLPADTEENELMKAFEEYGPIVKISVHKNESMINRLCPSLILPSFANTRQLVKSTASPLLSSRHPMQFRRLSMTW